MFSPRLNHQSSCEKPHSPSPPPSNFSIRQLFLPADACRNYTQNLHLSFLHSPWPRAARNKQSSLLPLFFRAVDVSEGGWGGTTKTTQHQKTLISWARELFLNFPTPTPPRLKLAPRRAFARESLLLLAWKVSEKA